MQKVTIICTGKLKEKFYLDAAAEYAKRLSRFCTLTILELPEERLPESPSPAQIEAALAREADAVRAKLPAGCLLIAMCVEGQERSSEALARYLAEAAARGAGQAVDPEGLFGRTAAGGAAGKQQCQTKQQEKDPLFHSSASSRRARGSSTMNTVPLPDCRCWARMEPPRRRTVSLTMLRPRPVPPTARERFLSTR